jgi:hypothetical protein
VQIHERLGNLAMVSLGQLSEKALAAILQITALGVLSALFAWWLVRCEGLFATHLWGCLATIWLGLTILPLVAGFLPQRREQNLYEQFHLTGKQRLALRLDKVFGIYISAFLGQVFALVTWLGLYYAGVWAVMSPALKGVFWFIVEWIALFLGFIGAVIMTKYWENLLQGNADTDLRFQHISLAAGFPVLIYPTLLLVSLGTLPLWQDPTLGCLTIALGFLVLAWMLSREAKKSRTGQA